MAWLSILILGSLPVSVGDAILESIHTYDLQHCEVRARVEKSGVAIRCGLRLKVVRPGPLRFLISSEVEGLEVRDASGEPLPFELGAGPLDALLERVAKGRSGLPTLLTVVVPSPTAGQPVELDLAYRWVPSGAGMAYASGGVLQSHLSGFWLPTMGDEFFTADVAVEGLDRCVATGAADGPVQVICATGGEFETFEREVEGRRIELWVPPGLELDPEAILDDFAAVLALQESWFGKLSQERLTLIVERRTQPSPSFCAQSYLVVHRSTLPSARGRLRWLTLLAHECSHLWFGHRLATPVIGKGGTWLREGLAQWAGIETAGALTDEDSERRLWRANFRAYLGSADLRRSKDGAVFANEVTLMDSTYLDPAAIPYLRGALVFRRLEHERGAENFRFLLSTLIQSPESRFVTGEEFARRTRLETLVDYYAGTTRIPELEVDEVSYGQGRASARIRCRDAEWPGGSVPCVVATREGRFTTEVRVVNGEGRLEWTGRGTPTRIEIDPERIHLGVPATPTASRK